MKIFDADERGDADPEKVGETKVLIRVIRGNLWRNLFSCSVPLW